MWCSLIALFLHQLEEYRIVGTFSGMVNAMLYRSPHPEHYPLNPRSAFIINVVVGWATNLQRHFWLIHSQQLASRNDYLLGLAAGIVLNVVGILKIIGWMADPDS